MALPGLPQPGEADPAANLADFLAAGPPPVFIGFGSMAPEYGERLSQVIADAVTRAGVRAVVQAGWAGLTGTGDRILAVGDLPHDWLFPQVAAVVHHAGAGTTGAGLRACGPVCRPSRCRRLPTSRSGRIGSIAGQITDLRA